MDKQVEYILESLGWEPELVLKAARSNSAAIVANQFLTALVENETVVDTAKALNCGSQTLNRLIDKHLVPYFGKLNGGNETWLYKLREFAGLKKCSRCQKILKYSRFGKDVHNSSGLHTYCTSCRKEDNAQWYSLNKEYHKNYLENNRTGFNANNAKRRATKLQATPLWADLSAIRKIYAECPKGYHIDHIYPLTSDWVCGLHVVENLKPIPEKDNMTKGNRYIKEIHG